jgi:hypothetical protein
MVMMIGALAYEKKEYSDVVKAGDQPTATRAGLCATCKFMRQIESDRGSVFYLCERSATDASFPKYPRLPVLQCRGYEPQDGATGSQRN